MSYLNFIKPPTDPEPDYVKALRAGRQAQDAVLHLVKRAQEAPMALRKNAPARSVHPWAVTLAAQRPHGERLGDELLGKIHADVIPFRKAAPLPPRSPTPRPPSQHPWPAAAKLETASMTKLKPRTL